jgi:hypothetical protein
MALFLRLKLPINEADSFNKKPQTQAGMRVPPPETVSRQEVGAQAAQGGGETGYGREAGLGHELEACLRGRYP